MSEPLSPAADAVDEAARNAWITRDYPRPIAAAALCAAALCAAAVQVDAVNVPDHIRGDAYWAYRNGRAAAEGHLLRIAAELEGSNA